MSFIKSNIEGIEIKPLELTTNLHYIPNSLYYYYKNKDNNVGLDDLSMQMGNNPRCLFVLPRIIKDNVFDNIYDYIIFDTPPSSNIITQSAFLLSDFLIIPTIMDDISIKGVEHYWYKIKTIYEKYCKSNKASRTYLQTFGAEIKLLGIFETMRVNNRNQIEEAIRTKIKSNGTMHLFDTLIKLRSDVVLETENLSATFFPDLNVGEGIGRSDCMRGYENLCIEIEKEINNG